eukprot:CAMPEP_0171202638 /NCGR_PEP_ID=MMETSP0790-20130122/25107_1 /TAXON_ID=2925 /ORGANISM="Alexandrium catenella, Strain OF101" /LENGTH=67 /DNA_ID=CAMNT_0011668071 /DNA_START=184 /DNA_END=384 /DNA_ORIENTATION=-
MPPRSCVVWTPDPLHRKLRHAGLPMHGAREPAAGAHLLTGCCPIPKMLPLAGRLRDRPGVKGSGHVS